MRLLQEQELGASESNRWMEVNLVQVQVQVTGSRFCKWLNSEGWMVEGEVRGASGGCREWLKPATQTFSALTTQL